MQAGMDIRIQPHPETPRVCIRGRRPPDLTPLLRGRAAAEAPDMVRVVLSVCGHAQARATALALGLHGHPAAGVAGAAAVLGEIAREHLLRVLSSPAGDAAVEGANDFPELKMAVRFPALLEARAREGAAALHEMAMALATLLERRVFGMPPAVWRAMTDPSELLVWMREARTPPARRLRRLVREGLADVGLVRPRFLLSSDPSRAEGKAFAKWLRARLLGLDGADFAATPLKDGQPHETGALARQHCHPLPRALMREAGGAGLLVRHVARLLELAALPEKIAALADTPAARLRRTAVAELGMVESARGLLAHAVRVDAQGRVRLWRAVAPTEWNFHPKGVLQRALAHVARRFHHYPHRLERLARALALALDPCVRCRVRVVMPEEWRAMPADAPARAEAEG